MKKGEKLLNKLKLREFQNWSFADARALLKHLGYTYDHTTGSHEIWQHPLHGLANLQKVKGQAKPYQLRQVLEQITK